MSEHLIAAYSLILLTQNNSILLLKRSASNSFAPNQYSLPGGRVEKDETFRQALLRELQEELGITIDEADLTYAHSLHRKSTPNELVAFVFECHQWQGQIINKEPAKHSHFEWVDIQNLPLPMVPAHEGAIAQIIKQQFHSEQN
jgi:8-oxo-dGTP diphosphatase